MIHQNNLQEIVTFFITNYEITSIILVITLIYIMLVEEAITYLR